MCLPGCEPCRIATESTPPSVFSTGTIPVVPAGTGAPVMIRCAVPGCSVNWSVRPAGMSSATGNTTGRSGVASAVSSAYTAYPSIAELSKTGSASWATTSSARTRPCASVNGTVTAGRALIMSATTR